MEIQALRTFQTVVEEGGILSAARKLNTVQSNVTARIKRLEEELDTALFYRKGRGLQLAPSGRVLLDYAQRILQLESQAGAALRQIGEHAGQLRIGSMETFAALRLPGILHSLRQHHDGLELHLEAGTSATLIERVLDYQLDCAFVGGPVEHPDLVAMEVSREELVLVRSKVRQDDRMPLILFREGCAYRARALAWRRESGGQIDNVMEFGTLDGILGCVAVGLGSTLMPRQVVEQNRYREELVLQDIDPGLARIPTALITHRDGLKLKALDTLRQAASETLSPTSGV